MYDCLILFNLSFPNFKRLISILLSGSNDSKLYILIKYWTLYCFVVSLEVFERQCDWSFSVYQKMKKDGSFSVLVVLLSLFLLLKHVPVFYILSYVGKIHLLR